MDNITVISYGNGPFIHRPANLLRSPLEEMYTSRVDWVGVGGVGYRIAGRGRSGSETNRLTYGVNHLPLWGDVYREDPANTKKVRKFALGVLFTGTTPLWTGESDLVMAPSHASRLQTWLNWELGHIASGPQNLKDVPADADRLVKAIKSNVDEQLRKYRSERAYNIAGAELWLFTAE